MTKFNPFSIPTTRACLALLAVMGARQASADFIDINFDPGVSDADRAVFSQAKTFWESHLTGFANSADHHRLTIDASTPFIDGAGGILGQAGPQSVSRIGAFTYSTSGVMQFDSADMASMRADGSLVNVIEHEMGHVLGIGTLWVDNGVYVDGTGRYTGHYALAGWQSEFNQANATFVPVEEGGGPGTNDGHWAEVPGGAGPTGFVSNITHRDFEYELMTGWANTPTFLSSVTTGSLRDMGYTIDAVYVYNGTASGTVVIPNAPASNVYIMESTGGWTHNTLEAGTTTIQSLAMSAGTTAATLDMGGAQTLVVGSGAGAAGVVGINAGAKSLTIGLAANDGFLTSGSSGASALTFVNGEAASTLTVNSAIRDNAGAGAVSVIVDGADGSQVVFNGNNTYTGGTNVNGGTLVLAAPSTALTGDLAVGAAGTLTVGDGTGAAHSRRLSFASASNANSIIIRSDGRVNLSSANTLTGAGTLTNEGMLAVTGTVTTTNALAASAGGVLVMANANSILNVGSVAIASGAKLAITSGSTADFLPGTLHTVVHATGTATGAFTIDTSLSAHLASGQRWVTRTVGQDVLLGIQYYIGGLSAGATPQQRAVEGGLSDATLHGASADLETEYARLTGLPGAQLNDALTHLSGHDRAAMDAYAQQHAIARGQNILQFAQMQLVNEETVISASTRDALRATCLSDLQSGDLEESYGLRFFTHAEHLTESRDQQTSGVLASDATGNVFMVGVHDQMTDDFNVGLAFTYDQTNVSTDNGLGKSDATTYALDLYFSDLFEESQRWFVAGDLGFGMSNYDNRRSGITPGNLTATSSASGTQIHAAGEIGYHASLWRDAMLTPYAGLSYAGNTVDAYSESLPGAPGLALSYGEHTASSTESVVGANFAQGIRLSGGYLLTPSLGVAWHHQLGGTGDAHVTTHFAGASNTTFNTYLGTPSADAIEIQGAVSLQVHGGLKVFVDGRHYEATGTNGSRQDRIGAGLSYDF